MKRIAALLLAVLLLLAGCAGKEGTAVLREHYELDIEYGDSIFYNPLGWECTERDRWEDDALQNAAAQIQVEYPLTTGDQIQAYACGLYDFCVERGYFPASLSAVDALQYEPSPEVPNNVWLLCFMNPDSKLYDDPGPGAYMLISGTDGHIIAWEYDETGDGFSAGVSRELYDINTIIHGLSIPEDFTAEDCLADEQLQTAVAQIPMNYPITTDEQIQEYAWALYEICMQQERFPSHFAPRFALLQDDGILRLSFSGVAFAEKGFLRYDGEGAHIWVSQEDGHIIDMRITLYD